MNEGFLLVNTTSPALEAARQRYRKDHLASWAARAIASGASILIGFAKTLFAHQTGLLAYYDCPISTGPLEGTNNQQ